MVAVITASKWSIDNIIYLLYKVITRASRSHGITTVNICIFILVSEILLQVDTECHYDYTFIIYYNTQK